MGADRLAELDRVKELLAHDIFGRVLWQIQGEEARVARRQMAIRPRCQRELHVHAADRGRQPRLGGGGGGGKRVKTFSKGQCSSTVAM